MAEPQANNIPVPKHLDEAREKTLSIAMASGGLNFGRKMLGRYKYKT